MVCALLQDLLLLFHDVTVYLQVLVHLLHLLNLSQGALRLFTQGFVLLLLSLQVFDLLILKTQLLLVFLNDLLLLLVVHSLVIF